MALKKRDDELALVPPSLARQAGQAVRAVGDVASSPFRTSANILTEAAAAVPPAARVAGAALGAGVRDFTQGFSGAPDIPAPAALTTQRNPAVPVLAAATAPPAPSFGNVGAGSRASTTPALSDSGRTLGYGSTINGVRTLSDGSGGPGAIPATVTAANLATLGAGRSLTRADPGVGGAIGTAAYGGTPPLGAFDGALGGGAIARPAAADPSAALLAKADRDADYAKSDLASIANRDPRSVLGTQARNADVEINALGLDPKDSALLKGASQRLQQESLADLEAGRSKATMTALGEAGATDRANITANASIVGDLARNRPTPSQVPLADGSLGLLGQDGIVRPAMDASGQPVKPREGKAVVDQGAYGKFLESATNRFLGADPLSGKITDPATGKQRDPRPEETLKAIRAARAAANEAFGDGSESNSSKGPPKPTKAEFMAQARAANPGVTDADLEAYFSQTYGG